ncbi:NlpC/P60 family protein [Actinokineospora pegani]|uniref:NlpC/P60 family protein n=1 Tax=Actinokineospora pegani TaxID=2654637 RepID=UPI0012EAC7F4|nr:NlpC/P60 family protein [Actinokineospora pegani]
MSKIGFFATSVALCAVVSTATTAAAVPPPPPNPSDSEIEGGRAEVNAKAGQVGELTSRLAQAEARLTRLQAEVEAKMEDANKARVDQETAERAAAEAESAARAADREAAAAGKAIETARGQLDQFAAGSYKQGSTVGSISAYLGASSPEDLLARAQLLNAVSGSRLDALDGMERARTVKANKDSQARAALELANAKEQQARQARAAADTATETARQARSSQASRSQELQAAKADYEQQLTAAQARVGGLEGQREKYQQWLAAKEREDAVKAAAAAAAAAQQGATAPQPGGGGGDSAGPAPVGSARRVIDRALSQLGVPYAWGGGNANGPTRGIRDGGVADSYGDFQKVGFDCSGLMIYAFAGVGISLPHYSGYQATAGRRVPLSQKAPGDMLFWASGGGRIHHVALYMGNGQMVEAPYSGSRVRIAPVRYGGIVPYATRLL